MDATGVLQSVPAPAVRLLFVDEERAASQLLRALSRHYDVTVATKTADALRAIEQTRPAVVVTELVLPDGTGSAVCRAAKTLHETPRVLVTTRDVDRVPDGLEAGCDAVLLKPYPPNLLISRLSRLTQVRSQELRTRAMRQRARAAHLQECSELLLHGTNYHWPSTVCPYCTHEGITSFEFMSYRRAWYACLGCRKVWIAARQEPWAERR